jgi:hypothetical protein
MKRRAFLLVTLVAAGLALGTPGWRAAADKPPDYVVVDPTDLRQPVPNPEQGLTQKYDGKVVRFTGVLHRGTVDKKTKTYRYEMRYDIVHKVRAKGTRPTVKKETIIVPVTFSKAEKRLRALKRGQPLTVQGTGSVMVDGTLVISDAVIVTDKKK